MISTRPLAITCLLAVLTGCGSDRQSTLAWPDPTPVDPPPAANPPAKPAPSKRERQAMADGVLAILHKNISSSQLNYRFNPSGEGVVLGTAGLAFIARGSTIAGGPHQKSLQAILRRLQQIMDQEQFQLQPVWGCAQSMVFLAELHRTAPHAGRKDIAKLLQRYTHKIATSQTAEGSWCHTFADVPNALGYRGLVAASVMAMQGLGMAQREGVKVDQAIIERGVGYLVASSNKGRIGYSPNRGQKGMAGPGRTAGGLLALLACNQHDHALVKPASAYLSDSFSDAGLKPRPSATLQGGHASAQMGLAWAAWFAGATRRYDDFWAGQGGVIAARRQADGSFTPAPSDGKTPTGPSEIGDFANAWHALILVADSPHLQIGRHGSAAAAVQNGLRVLAGIVKDWEGEALPESAVELAKQAEDVPPDPKKIAKDLKDACKDLAKREDVAFDILLQLLDLHLTGAARWNADKRTVEVLVTLSRCTIDGMAKGKLSIADPRAEPLWRAKSKSVKPSAIGTTDIPIPIKLGRKDSPPDSVQVTIEWTIDRRKHTSSTTIPITTN